ncbi:MAG: aminotransferase class III-fold pyridoxal phosphate-dependent enzyme [Candidatus Marinimicrobia bacterium]|nr:aminotransferase class III-fold pyridoxal phosphate-dependent enzyme [Candidatus Neomarinimicrobiota bacterium]
MKLFDVYPLFDITPVRGEGPFVYDEEGTEYLDFYGGHAVISIGHSHPLYVRKIQDQATKIGFYSNSVQNPLQGELAQKLGEQSGYEDYSLFLCNSGAEAVENALKLASFHNERTKIVALQNEFHGRTSAAVAVTDNPKIQAPINRGHDVAFLPWNNADILEEHLKMQDVSSVIVEGLQGIGGIHQLDREYLQTLQRLCNENGTMLIIDEIQSGYGRTGKFFAHQHYGIKPDLITVAKGMGNGFPIAGVLISPEFNASYGLLGSTFGGNHLACAAGIAVLEVIERERLIENAAAVGDYLMKELSDLKGEELIDVRGMGLMIGIEFDDPVADFRKNMLFEHNVFTGSSSDKNTLRLLPPLVISKDEADLFLQRFKSALSDFAG